LAQIVADLPEKIANEAATVARTVGRKLVIKPSITYEDLTGVHARLPGN